MTLPAGRARGPFLPGGPAAIDLPQLRFDLHATMLADVLEGAAALVGRAKLSLDELRRYAAALRASQELCLQEALRFFPMDRVIRRFAKIWAEDRPAGGQVHAADGQRDRSPGQGRAQHRLGPGKRSRVHRQPCPRPSSFCGGSEENLVAAATTLHHALLSPHLSPPAAMEGRGHRAPRQAPIRPLR